MVAPMLFDMICQANGTEHRLARRLPRKPRPTLDAPRRLMTAYDFARRLKTLSGLTPYEYIAKIWTSEPSGSSCRPLHASLAYEKASPSGTH